MDGSLQTGDSCGTVDHILLIAARKGMKDQRKETGMKQKIINIIGILFLVAGIVSLLYPEIMSYLKKKQSDQTVKELTQESSQTKQSDPLYQKAVRYNRKIFQENRQD